MKNIIVILIILLPLAQACHNKEKDDQSEVPESGSLLINGNRLNYVVQGEGIPCMVIGSSIYYPRTFSDSLKKRLKMYFVDMPWFSEDPAELDLDKYTIKDIAGDIEEIRKKLDLSKPVIIGHSIHGTIAYEYAKLYPDNISGIIVIGSPNLYGNDAYNEVTDKAWATASADRKEKQGRNWQKLAESTNTGKEGETIREYLAMAPVYWYDPDYDASWLWEDMTVNEGIIDHIYSKVFNDYRMFETMNNIPAPMLVVTGKYDYAVPYTMWQGYDSVSGLTVKMLEESGHTPQLEESDKFDEYLLKWISENLNY